MSSDHGSFNQSAHGTYTESLHGVRNADEFGDLYVGGDFFRVGGVIFRDIARWDYKLETWNQLGLGCDAGGGVRHMLVFEGKLCIIGTFTSFDGVSANRIALWDGSTATTLGTGFNSPANFAYIWKGDLYVSGEFGLADGVTVNRIAKWNGTTFEDLDGGIPTGFGSNITKMHTDPQDGNLVVSGSFTDIGTGGLSPAPNNVAKWDGTSWSRVVQLVPLQSFVSDAGLWDYKGNLIAGCTIGIGAFLTGPSSWDGTLWTRPFSPGTNTSSQYTLKTIGNKIFCANIGLTSAGGNPVKQMAFYDSETSTWSDQGGGVTIGLMITSEIATWNGKLIYTGSWTSISGVSAKRVVAYDPVTEVFTALGSGIDDGTTRCAIQFKA